MNLKGYIFSRPFFGERAPQHVQNIVIRDYCNKKKIYLELSNTEYSDYKSTKILMNIIDNIDKYDGVIFYSLFQLPTNFEDRKKVFKTIMKKKKTIHFALENKVGYSKDTLNYIEKIYLIKKNQFETFKFKMGKKKNFVSKNHYKTKRNYVERMMNEKIKCMKISKKYNYDYWDGNRRYGYGGYNFIKGYHTDFAKKIISEYNLTNYSKILDIGCGKGYLLYEIKSILKNIEIVGIDISKYAKMNSKKEIRRNIIIYDARKKLKFKDNYFDLVLSINTLHNFKLNEIEKSLQEIERVGKSKFICVESYRNEREQFNLQCWALTAETIIDVMSWKWLFNKANYSGDYEFIYFK